MQRWLTTGQTQAFSELKELSCSNEAKCKTLLVNIDNTSSCGKCGRRVFMHELLTYQKSHSFDFWYKNNECGNKKDVNGFALILALKQRYLGHFRRGLFTLKKIQRLYAYAWPSEDDSLQRGRADGCPQVIITGTDICLITWLSLPQQHPRRTGIIWVRCS